MVPLGVYASRRGFYQHDYYIKAYIWEIFTSVQEVEISKGVRFQTVVPSELVSYGIRAAQLMQI